MGRQKMDSKTRCDRILDPCISGIEVKMNRWGMDIDDVLAYSTQVV